MSANFEGSVKVSCGMGSGLALNEQKPGKIIIFAGGTGVYPYIDTFDILDGTSLDYL